MKKRKLVLSHRADGEKFLTGADFDEVWFGGEKRRDIESVVLIIKAAEPVTLEITFGKISDGKICRDTKVIYLRDLVTVDMSEMSIERSKQDGNTT